MISLERLYELVEQFKSETHKEYVYKICLSKYIIIMEKLADTITNESRCGVIDMNAAKFRADKLRVVLIIDLMDSSTITTKISNTYLHSCPFFAVTDYEVGSIVLPDSFEPDLDAVCANGIHYFRSVESAFFYNKYTGGYTGVWKRWSEQGQLMEQRYYIDGVQNGEHTMWFTTGQLRIRCNLVDGLKVGQYEEWDTDGSRILNLYFDSQVDT